MSQLTTNTTSLQAILDAVNALPEAGGGASIETCTVKIMSGDDLNQYYGCVATVLADGVTTVDFESYAGGVQNSFFNKTFSDCVCGSGLTVNATGYNDNNWKIDGAAELLAVNVRGAYFHILPEAAGTTVTLTLYSND